MRKRRISSADVTSAQLSYTAKDITELTSALMVSVSMICGKLDGLAIRLERISEEVEKEVNHDNS